MYIQSDRADRGRRELDSAADRLVSHQVFDDVCEMVDGLVQMGHQTLQGAPPSVCFLVRMVFKALGAGSAPRQRCPRGGGIIDDEVPQETDFAVLGGGMAGLQIAVSLSRSLKGSGQNVTVVEPRETYEDDRTFCFGMCQRRLVRPLSLIDGQSGVYKQTESLTLLHPTATNTFVYLVRRSIQACH